MNNLPRRCYTACSMSSSNSFTSGVHGSVSPVAVSYQSSSGGSTVSTAVASEDTKCREYLNCQEAVTCPICLNMFLGARRLPCSHTFCLNCLYSYQRTKSSSKCPTCREPTVPESSKLDALPVNAFANEVAQLLTRYQSLSSKGNANLIVIWPAGHEKLLRTYY